MAGAEIEGIERITALVPHLLDIAHKKMWADYDQKADVLYINLKSPAMPMNLS